MKKALLLALIPCTLGGSAALFAQTNPSVPSTTVSSILLGHYTPADYQATTVITDPATISAGLLANISTDSLTADLVAFSSFQNRNTFSDTTSTTRGIG